MAFRNLHYHWALSCRDPLGNFQFTFLFIFCEGRNWLRSQHNLSMKISSVIFQTNLKLLFLSLPNLFWAVSFLFIFRWENWEKTSLVFSLAKLKGVGAWLEKQYTLHRLLNITNRHANFLNDTVTSSSRQKTASTILVILTKMNDGDSVTRLADFWKILATKFPLKVA